MSVRAPAQTRIAKQKHSIPPYTLVVRAANQTGDDRLTEDGIAREVWNRLPEEYRSHIRPLQCVTLDGLPREIVGTPQLYRQSDRHYFPPGEPSLEALFRVCETLSPELTREAIMADILGTEEESEPEDPFASHTQEPEIVLQPHQDVDPDAFENEMKIMLAERQKRYESRERSAIESKVPELPEVPMGDD